MPIGRPGARVGLLDRVHREGTDRVDGLAGDVWPGRSARSRGVRRWAAAPYPYLAAEARTRWVPRRNLPLSGLPLRAPTRRATSALLGRRTSRSGSRTRRAPRKFKPPRAPAAGTQGRRQAESLEPGRGPGPSRGSSRCPGRAPPGRHGGGRRLLLGGCHRRLGMRLAPLSRPSASSTSLDRELRETNAPSDRHGGSRPATRGIALFGPGRDPSVLDLGPTQHSGGERSNDHREAELRTRRPRGADSVHSRPRRPSPSGITRPAAARSGPPS